MRIFIAGVLCGVLLTAGCTRQEVNSASVIRYEEGDEAGVTALKTAGNLPSWIMGAPIYAIGWIGEWITGGHAVACPCLGLLAGISFRK